MFARKSTHKSRRSATRADKTRAERGLGGGRTVLDVAFFSGTSKGKAKEKEVAASSDGSEEADARCLRNIRSHIFTHALDVILPLPGIDSNEVEDPLALLQSRDSALAALLQQVGSSKSHPFYVAKVPLALFLNPEFVTGFIRNGSLTALSIHPSQSSSSTAEDPAQDTVALDGLGILHLSLSRETYQTLGLVGRESRFHRGPSGRYGDRSSGLVQSYVVELPLTGASFVPGKRGYERALACLRAWDRDRASKRRAESMGDTGEVGSGLRADLGKQMETDESETCEATWDMLFAWTPPDFSTSTASGGEGSRPRSQGKIVFPKSFVAPSDVREISTAHSIQLIKDVWVPSLAHPAILLPDADSTSTTAKFVKELILQAEPTLLSTFAADSECGRGGDMDDVIQVVQGLSEWTALSALQSENVRTYSRPDPLVSSISVPTPRWAGSVLHLSLRGFLTPRACTDIVQAVQTYLDASAAPSPSSSSTSTDRSPAAAGARDITSQIGQSYTSAREADVGAGRWASITADGFEHAPVAWASAYPGLGTALGSGLVLGSAVGKGLQGAERPAKQRRTEQTKKRRDNTDTHEDDDIRLDDDDEGATADRAQQGASGHEDDMETSTDSGTDDDDDVDASSAGQEQDDDEEEEEAFTPSTKAPPQQTKAKKKNAKQRARLKRKRRGHVRRGEAEHAHEAGGASRGKSGWTAILLGRECARAMGRSWVDAGGGRDGSSAGMDSDGKAGAGAGPMPTEGKSIIIPPRYVLLEDVGRDTRQ
ncbi:hypothetical protein V8E36_007466 [Tilletia maclaganii]